MDLATLMEKEVNNVKNTAKNVNILIDKVIAQQNNIIYLMEQLKSIQSRIIKIEKELNIQEEK